jgi:hypothetical protein
MALTQHDKDPGHAKKAKTLIAINAGGTWAGSPFHHAKDAFDYAGDGGHVYREVDRAEAEAHLADPEGLSHPVAEGPKDDGTVHT